MIGNASKYPDKRLTVAAAKAQLAQFLYGCREEALARVTVGELALRFRVDPKTIAVDLAAAREKRGVAA